MIETQHQQYMAPSPASTALETGMPCVSPINKPPPKQPQTQTIPTYVVSSPLAGLTIDCNTTNFLKEYTGLVEDFIHQGSNPSPVKLVFQFPTKSHATLG